MNLLNEASNSKFVSRKLIIVNDQSNTNYDVGNEIIYDTEVLKSNICDYNDTYILVRGDITIIAVHVTQEAFKSCSPFINCFTKNWLNNNRWCRRVRFINAGVPFDGI